MKLKTINEYSKEMTRIEFDKFTEENLICPRHFNLKDIYICDDDCKKCYDATLIGINFKSAQLILSNETLNILKSLEDLELQSKIIKEQHDSLKANLLKAMEQHDITKWDNDILSITYVAPTVKSTLDGKKLKENLPEVFNEYTKKSNVKASVRIKLK